MMLSVVDTEKAIFAAVTAVCAPAVEVAPTKSNPNASPAALTLPVNDRAELAVMLPEENVRLFPSSESTGVTLRGVVPPEATSPSSAWSYVTA